MSRTHNVRRTRITKSTDFRKKRASPRTTAEYFERSTRFQGLWDRVLAVISKMRTTSASLQNAAREVGITPRTVVRWGGSALRKRTNGRYAAKKSDKLLRVLMVPTSDGVREIGIRNSRDATMLSAYWRAVHKYLSTGDAADLHLFRDSFITTDLGMRLSLPTDPQELDRLGSAGVLSFESLYARAS